LTLDLLDLLNILLFGFSCLFYVMFEPLFSKYVIPLELVLVCLGTEYPPLIYVRREASRVLLREYVVLITF
jgi:hypothetical protein